MKKKKVYYIYSLFICLLLIINIIINIPLLKSIIYGYDAVKRDYDIELYVYVIVMVVCLAIIILNIIGMWLYKKDKKSKLSIVLITLSIILLVFLSIQAIYTINSTINLLNQYEGSKAPHLYVHILQLVFSVIGIIIEIIKFFIVYKLVQNPKENVDKHLQDKIDKLDK